MFGEQVMFCNSQLIFFRFTTHFRFFLDQSGKKNLHLKLDGFLLRDTTPLPLKCEQNFDLTFHIEAASHFQLLGNKKRTRTIRHFYNIIFHNVNIRK